MNLLKTEVPKNVQTENEIKSKLVRQRNKLAIVFLSILSLVLAVSVVKIYQAKEQERIAKELATAYGQQANILLKATLTKLTFEEKKFIYNKTDSIVYKNNVLKEQNYNKAAKTARIYCALYENIKLDSSLRAEAYANFGWYLFFTKNFDRALKNIQKGSILDNNTLWIQEDLALAYFFTNQFDKGKEIFEIIKTDTFKQEKVSRPFREQFIEDFKTLKQRDVIPPDIDKIEELLNYKFE
jgi:tetratricopeptide (TPR) repeat protein